MKRINRACALLSALMALVALWGCGGGNRQGQGAQGEGEGQGRYLFDAPAAFTYFGTLDIPRLAVDPGSGRVHLVYLLLDGTSQRIMYTRMENGEFNEPALLSQTEGRKSGGGYLAIPSRDYVIAYWINVAATGGQLRYKTSDNGARTWTIEARWNERSEARWPCVMKIGSDITAYFFLHSGDDWELAVNRNFSVEDEPAILTAQGTPYNLQGFADGTKKIRLAYFVRREMSNEGRLALLRSDDGGATFSRAYLFEDRLITSMTGFFSIARSVSDGREYIHLIFTEEEPELTALYYARSNDGGETFSMPVAFFSSEISLTQSPLLMANGKYVFIATADADEENGPSLRYVLSENSGEGFTEPAVATHNVSSPGTRAGLLNSDGSIMLVWDDISAESEGDEQLFRMNGSLRGR